MKIIALSLVGLLAITAVLARDDPSIFGHDLQLNLGENLHFTRVSDAKNNKNGSDVSYGSSGVLSDNKKSGSGSNVERNKVTLHRGNNTSRREPEYRVLQNHSKRESRRVNYRQHRHGENGNTNGSTSQLASQTGL